MENTRRYPVGIQRDTCRYLATTFCMFLENGT